ncbi:MAG: anti-sigma factor [Sphingomonadales bacterium]|nr:anti-sigma factor [Sphingomonadales bacterium]MDE2168394.1 anti-sigma factor [Sphingomonadales bacterium]
MTDMTDEEIMAYVDGELEEEARGRVTLAALGDPDLAERIAAQRALRDRLSAHFAPIAQAPVPPEWARLIRQKTTPEPPRVAQVVDLAAARAARQPKQSGQTTQGRAWVSAAMAACLAIGVFAGTQWHGRDTGPISVKDGALVASGALGHALDTQLASAQGSGSIRMLGTFRRESGDVCRVFSGQQASGIACHDKGQWQLQHVLPGSQPEAGDYRQAGSADAELMGLAQSMAKGDPLDAQQEQAAKAKGWQ